MKKQKTKDELLCEALGLWSLTELRFVTCSSLGVTSTVRKYLSEWLRSKGLSFGKHSKEEYLKNRKAIWDAVCTPLVFKYKMRTAVPGQGVTKEWAVGEFQFGRGCFSASGKPKITFCGVTAAQAQDIIDQFGMVLVEKNADGWIYDTPDGAFLKQFGHGSADLSGANWISLPGRDEDE